APVLVVLVDHHAHPRILADVAHAPQALGGDALGLGVDGGVEAASAPRIAERHDEWLARGAGGAEAAHAAGGDESRHGLGQDLHAPATAGGAGTWGARRVRSGRAGRARP